MIIQYSTDTSIVIQNQNQNDDTQNDDTQNDDTQNDDTQNDDTQNDDASSARCNTNNILSYFF